MDYTGLTISHYHVIEKLGHGGMANVYRAYDTRLERDVAIKVIRLESIPVDQQNRILERFKREVNVLVKLAGTKGIVDIYDTGEVDKTPFLVMELMSKKTLRDYMGRKINYQLAARKLLPIAEGLSVAHQQGFIHRDVKPSNILIDKKGNLHLADFGIAKGMNNEDYTLTETGMGVGTSSYMSPEQWKGNASFQSDVYSLGAVYYEMVTGNKPFNASTASELLLKVMTESFRDPGEMVDGLPGIMGQFLARALAKDSDDRCSLNEMIIGLRFLSGLTVGEDLTVDFLTQNTSANKEGETAQKTAKKDLNSAGTLRKNHLKTKWLFFVVSGVIGFVCLFLFFFSREKLISAFQTDKTVGEITQALTLKTPTKESTATPYFIVVTNIPMPSKTPETLLFNGEVQIFEVNGNGTANYLSSSSGDVLLVEQGTMLDPDMTLMTDHDVGLRIGIGSSSGNNHILYMFDDSNIHLMMESGFQISAELGEVYLEPHREKAVVNFSGFNSAYATVEDGRMVASIQGGDIVIECYEGLCVFFDNEEDLSPDRIPVGKKRIHHLGEDGMDMPQELSYAEKGQRNVECYGCLIDLVPTPTATFEQPTETKTAESTLEANATITNTQLFMNTTTKTKIPTKTNTPFLTATQIKTATPTRTSTPVRTNTPIKTVTPISTMTTPPQPTNTSVPTATRTPTRTRTSQPTSTP